MALPLRGGCLALAQWGTGTNRSSSQPNFSPPGRPVNLAPTAAEQKAGY